MARWLPDIRRGDTYRIKIQYPAGTNIAGYIHTFTVRTDYDAASPTISQSSVAGSASGDDAANGLAYLTVPAANTVVDVGKYVYDLQMQTPAGEIRTLVPPTDDHKDPMRVVPEVTRA